MNRENIHEIWSPPCRLAASITSLATDRRAPSEERQETRQSIFSQEALHVLDRHLATCFQHYHALFHSVMEDETREKQQRQLLGQIYLLAHLLGIPLRTLLLIFYVLDAMRMRISTVPPDQEVSTAYASLQAWWEDEHCELQHVQLPALLPLETPEHAHLLNRTVLPSGLVCWNE